MAKPTHEQRWNPLIGIITSALLGGLLFLTIGPHPFLVGYFVLAGIIWLLLSTGIVDQ